jgi:hypothetical protein
MAVSTHALEHAISPHHFLTESTSKLCARLITQQQNRHLGGRQFQRKHKKAADGLLGFLAPKIFHLSKKSLAVKAVDGHRTRPDGTDLKWKQIGVKEITDSRELPFFIEWLTEDHPSKDGITVSKIEKIVISDKDQLSDSWFKTEILEALDKVVIEWVDPLSQDGETGIVSVHLSTPNGSVR